MSRFPAVSSGGLSLFLKALLLPLLSACEGSGGPFPYSHLAPSANDADTPAYGSRGMVSSAHPLATEVGLEILEAGGNAFDAAVAVAAALGVVEPMMSGMGGYGTILVYGVDEDRVRFLNSSGRIPRETDPDAFRAPTPGYRENRRGAKAVSTPGNVNAWAAMWEEYGRLPWQELLEPAARLAEEGYAVDHRIARLIQAAWDDFPQHARAFYGLEGRPLEAGERLVQEDLARSLRLVAREGAGALHGGSLGEAVHQAMQSAGGFLRLQDLEENEAEWWDPIEIEYRGHRVVVPPPPANSFPALVRLGMMSRVDVEALGHNSVDYLHLFAEVTKHAFWTRLRYAGDPDVSPPPLHLLLSSAYWEEQVARIHPDVALPFSPPGPMEESSQNTTHFVVADAQGNVVSATQTLGNSFGSRIMPEGTGIWLNNSLAYCTFEPPGNPMDAHPGRRKLSGDVPLMVMRGGRPWIAMGTPGGHSIPQTVPQMVMNILDFGMDIQAAIAAPRISFSEPNLLMLEEALPEAVMEGLEEKGHSTARTQSLGNAHGLTVDWGADGRPRGFTGGADPRGTGLAKGR
jgi:gamma-glutamyltranspeptidase / glutathione hydrolase